MRKKILIVEDNTKLLELTRLNLKAAGFSVATAANGVEAIKKARSVAPDLILLDLALPELDGFAVCEILRQDQAMAAMPILILTGMGSEFTRLAGLESGANDYLAKPVNPNALVEKIRAMLSVPPKAVEATRLPWQGSCVKAARTCETFTDLTEPTGESSPFVCSQR